MLEGTSMVDDSALAESVPFYRSAEVREQRERLLQVLDTLPAQERTVIRCHYLQQIPFDQVALMLHLTKGRVSQIHKQALPPARNPRCARSARPHLLIGHAMNQTGSVSSRAARLAGYLREDPGNPSLLAEACDEALAAGLHTLAARHMDAAEALRLDPAGWTLRRARSCIAQRKLEEAARLLQHLLATQPGHPAITHDLAYVRLLQGAPEASRDLLASWMDGGDAADPDMLEALQCSGCAPRTGWTSSKRRGRGRSAKCRLIACSLPPLAWPACWRSTSAASTMRAGLPIARCLTGPCRWKRW
ncbi:sigma-70 family RNA polymerase sigma factor [Ramlibacter terrae]|uniref:Sigma-70 family RNA polymerase sigma factor n=1 Tax=Ramlibacter terrae TaxID=2732511 RepID=A0ABX6P5U5_9BURK|nr:sigma-70 family RNA polymerase sigma factor [Ramlibacter terrae]